MTNLKILSPEPSVRGFCFAVLPVGIYVIKKRGRGRAFVRSAAPLKNVDALSYEVGLSLLYYDGSFKLGTLCVFQKL